MKTWNCYSWVGASPSAESKEPAQSWSSPEGGTEFLRRALEDHDLYSKDVLIEALADLRQGKDVALSYPLPSGAELHLAVTPR